MYSMFLRNMNSPEVPKALRNFKRGNLGVFKKQKKNFHNINNMKRHSENPLHLWCASADMRKKQEEVEENRKNDLACEMIVQNALHTLKDPCGSSQEFVRLNNKDDLNPNLQFGDKNDGAEMYLTLRSAVF